jgi:deoxyribonuclease V
MINQLSNLQQQLAKQLIIPNEDHKFKSDDLIFSLDIQYQNNIAFVGLDIQTYAGEIIGAYVTKTSVDMEYIPQFFCFREGPPLLKIIDLVQKQFNLNPDLLIVDGHGIAHPRRFGVACWLGVQTNLPVIGCAKRSLLPYQGNLGEKRGSCLSVLLQQEVVGKVLRTQDNVKPVFVSIGNKINLNTAVNVILQLSSKYRICEPLRRADQIARAYAKNVNLINVSIVK